MVDFDEVGKKSLVYSIPGMEQAHVQKDITYKTIESLALKMDLYTPASNQRAAHLPAVVFVHGDGPPEFLLNAKDWGQYVSWGQLVATSGLAAITFNHRSTLNYTMPDEVMDDINCLIQHVREHAKEFGIEEDSLCIWTASAGTPFGLRAAMQDTPAYVKCIVSYYGPMDLTPIRGYFPSSASDVIVNAYSATRYIRQNIAPLFIAKAGQDFPELNASIDIFLKEALAANIPLTFVNHPSGKHGFDVLDDDIRSREIIHATLEFMKTHLQGSR